MVTFFEYNILPMPFSLVLLLFFGLFLLVNPLTVLFHELGHAIPAILATGEKATIYIGSYGKQERSFCIRLRKIDIWVKPGWWKQGLCIFPEGLSRRMTIISILCGPLASLTIGGIATWLIFSMDAHGFAKLVIIIFLFSAIVDFIFNLIPREIHNTGSEWGTLYSDGYTLRQMLRHKPVSTYHDFEVNEYGTIDPDEAETFLNGQGEFTPEFYRHAIVANLFKNRYARAMELHNILADKTDLNADDYCNAGNIYMGMLDYPNALQAFEIALSLDNDHSFSWVNRGYYFYKHGEHNRAMSDMDRAIAINPEFTAAYAYRSLPKMKMLDLTGAAADIEKARSLNADDIMVTISQGALLIELNIKEDALQMLNSAKKRWPEIELIDELLEQAESMENL